MKNIEGPRKEQESRPQLQEELRIEEPRNLPPPNIAKKDPKPEMGDITPRDDSGEDSSGYIDYGEA